MIANSITPSNLDELLRLNTGPLPDFLSGFVCLKHHDFRLILDLMPFLGKYPQCSSPILEQPSHWKEKVIVFMCKAHRIVLYISPQKNDLMRQLNHAHYNHYN